VATQAPAVETAKGRCPQHGEVEGRRVIPDAKVYGPASYLAKIMRQRTARKAPFVCPYCERDIELDN